MVVYVADVGGPVLVPPPRGEGHLALIFDRPLRFLQAVELAVGGQDGPQVLGLRCIPICARAAWIRYSPRWGFCWKRLTASIALSVTLRTPGGRPWGLSSRPSIPSSAHRFGTLWTVALCTPM